MKKGFFPVPPEPQQMTEEEINDLYQEGLMVCREATTLRQEASKLPNYGTIQNEGLVPLLLHESAEFLDKLGTETLRMAAEKGHLAAVGYLKERRSFAALRMTKT